MCGVRIDAFDLDGAAVTLLDMASSGESRGVHLCNAYVLSLATRDEHYSALLNRGDLNLPDGVPIAAIGRHLGLSSLTGPASGPDLMLETIRRGVTREVKHYLYGGSRPVVEQLVTQLRSLVPEAAIVGIESPPFRPLDGREIDDLVERLGASGADIVWVGLGTPKQDLLIDRLQGRVPAVLVPVGAAFDFIAGAKRRAPVWMRRTGLEWLFRLVSEPRRLGGRYLVGNLRFLVGAMRDRALVARPDAHEPALPGHAGTREIISPTRWKSRLGRLLLLLDATTIGIASLLAYLFRSSIVDESLGPLNVETAVPLLVLPFWLAILNAFGCHSPKYQSQGGEAFRRFLGGTGVAVILLGFLSFVFNLNVSRIYVGALFVIVLVLGTASRAVVRRQLARLRRAGRLLQRVLLVGADAEAIEVARAMHLDPVVGYHVVGFLDDVLEVGTVVLDDLRVLGSTRDVLAVAVRHGTGLAVISPTAVTPGTLRDVTLQLEGSPIDLAVAPSLFEIVTRRVAVESVGNVPILHVEQMRVVGWRGAAKWLLDLFGGVALFVATIPVFVGAAVAIKLQRDGGPVFFTQIRVGREGQPFTLFKFRTMVPDAEDRRSELEDLNEAGHIFFKVKDDPRVTRVGSFLRRWSIDELPQVLNVLRGEMSLVGPRPALPEEVEKYDSWQLRRLRVRPGITGVWQVSGRSNVPFDEAVRLDLFYIENWSLGYDLFLLGKTVLAVLGRRGAY